MGFACGAMTLVVGALLRALPDVTPAHFFVLAGPGGAIYASAALAVNLAGSRSLAQSTIGRRLFLKIHAG